MPYAGYIRHLVFPTGKLLFSEIRTQWSEQPLCAPFRWFKTRAEIARGLGFAHAASKWRLKLRQARCGATRAPPRLNRERTYAAPYLCQ